MDPKDFADSTAGRCVAQPENYWAFLPNPLPPLLDVDWALTHLLAEANARVGELSGSGRLLSNPHLLIDPYLRREAVLSSRIENTQAGMEDLFFFEADETEPPRVPDVQEVANYVQAMEYGLKRLETLPISGRLVREIHEILMRNVRGEHATPGEFRRTQNWIGPPGCTLMEATFVPPPVEDMKTAFSFWEKYLNEDPKEPPLIQCALMHYQFEAIHPFIDGNGRVGRLLISFLLCERGMLPLPLLYLSSFFERHRDEYYERLLDVSRRGNWRGWIDFFLRGVATQAEEATQSASAILDLNSELQERVRASKNAPRHTLRVIDRLFENPVISVPKLASDMALPYNSVLRCVRFLEKLSILEELTGQQRNRLYVAPRLMDILIGRPELRRSTR